MEDEAEKQPKRARRQLPFLWRTSHEIILMQKDASYQTKIKELQSALDAMMETYNRAVDRRQQAEEAVTQLKHALKLAVDLLNDIDITPSKVKEGRRKSEQRKKVNELARVLFEEKEEQKEPKSGRS